MADFFAVIKQFRSIGRFAWAFFFIANIMAIFILDRMILNLKDRKRRALATALIVLIPAVMASEGLEYHRDVSRGLTRSPNLFSLAQTTDVFQEDCRRIDPDQYQAMIALPFFCIGSENFNMGANDETYRPSFMFSYHLGLPMVDSYLTRTSIPESKHVMQLLASDFYDKEIQYHLKSDKPFLVICSNQGLGKADSNLLRKAVLLVKREDYSLYEIGKASLFRNSADAEQNEFRQKKENLFQKEGFLVTDTNLYFSFVGFNRQSAAFSSLEDSASVWQENRATVGQDIASPTDRNRKKIC